MSRFKAVEGVHIDDLASLYVGLEDEVNARLKELGVSAEIPKPKEPPGLAHVQKSIHGDPYLEEDISEVHSNDLGVLHSFFTEWANYTQAEATRAKCTMLIYKRVLTLVEAARRTYYKSDQGLPANEAADRVLIDVAFVEADAEALRLEILYQTLDSRSEQMRRTVRNISREIARRSDDLQRVNPPSGNKGWDRTPMPAKRYGRPNHGKDEE